MAIGIFLADFEQRTKVHPKGGRDRYLRWLPHHDHSGLIKEEDAKVQQVELRGPGIGQGLVFIRGSNNLLTTIAADPRIKRIPGDTLLKPISELSNGERNAVAAQIERMGYDIIEITARFPNFQSHTLLEVFRWAAATKPWFRPQTVDGVIGQAALASKAPNLDHYWKNFLRPTIRRVRPHNSGPYGSSVLDNFNRSNEDPLSGGGDWSNAFDPDDADMALVSNVIQSTTGDWGSAWWAVETFADPCEVHARISHDDGDEMGLALCLNSPGTGGVDGYTTFADTTIASRVDLERIDNQTYTTIISNAATSAGDDDYFALACVDGVVEIWEDTGGGWAEIDSVADANYSSGYLGVQMAWNTSQWDDFGGGALSFSPVFDQKSWRIRNDDGPIGEPL